MVAIWDVDSGRPLLGPRERNAVDDDAIRQAGAERWGDRGRTRLLRLANRTAVFTADSTVVAEPDAGRITLRDADSGRLLPTLPISVAVKDSRSLPAMAFSPDGRLLAAVGQIDGSGPLQLGVWDVATGDRFLPDMAIPVAGDEIQRLIFAPDSGRLQVECRTCAWHVPINRDAADMAPADLTADVELATGMTIDRERDGALMPIDLREAWQRRSGSAAARSTPANAQGIELARRSLAAGDDFAGAYWLGQAIALRPDSPAEWHLLLAKAYLSRGQSKAARAAAQNAARAAAQQAEAQGRDSEVDNDVGAFSRPVQTQVEAMLGLAAFADQDWPEAIANLERASAAHGADSRWLRALAFAYAEVGARERARDTLERAIESGGDDDFSDDLEVATRKGRLRMQLLIWDHAIQTGHTDWWEEVLLPAQIHAQRGRVLIHLEAWSEGIADFDAAIARGADVPWVRTLRSFAREQLGKAEAATQGLETIDPP